MKRLFTTTALTLLLALVLTAPTLAAEGEKKYDPTRWEDTIKKFEARDKENPPEAGGVLFIGSSSIRGWDLDESFPDLHAINRGFGGSHIEDSTHYAHRIIWPYKPRTILLYAGDNDIAWGKTPETVVKHFQGFVERVREKLPDAKIVFIPTKPSIKRWEMWPTMKKANAAIEAITRDDPKLAYADTATPMLGDDGKPMEDLFVKDGLHLSKKGYEMWSDVVREHVK